jgi:uncharacterized YccA/Bax inhibitor family protein
MRFHSKNPVLTKIASSSETSYSYVTGKTATFSGIAIKTGILLAIIFGISAVIWANIEALTTYLPLMIISGMIIGFISVIVASVSNRAAPFFTILYAICEGLVLGSISGIVNFGIEAGLVANAVLITFVIFGFLLVAYSTGIFKVGFTFRKIFMTALFSIVIFTFIYSILTLFGLSFIKVSFEFLLILSIIMIIMASFSLLIDFDNCKMAVSGGLPSRYEWNLSLGLLVSLVWLYMEVLRLLILLASRRD